MSHFIPQTSLENKIFSLEDIENNSTNPSPAVEVSKSQLLHSIAYAMNNGHKKYGSKLLGSFNQLFDKESSYTSICTLQDEDKRYYETLLSLENSTNSR